MKTVKKILGNVIPRINPVADNRWWSKAQKRWMGIGEIILWEVLWFNQTWYVYKGTTFPYTEVQKAVPVKHIGQYWYWKGTYKD